MKKIHQNFLLLPISIFIFICTISIFYEFVIEDHIGGLFFSDNHEAEPISKRWEYVLISAISAFLSLIVPTWYGIKLIDKQEALTKELHKTASEDSLTGLFTRRILNKLLANELLRLERFNHRFSIIIIDIDHFKSINDEFGHLIGDSVIKQFSDILSDNIRQNDVVGRWGGEEFLIICPETEVEGAVELANKLKNIVQDFEFKKVENKTASFGVTCSKHGQNMDDIVNQADKALYQAKRLGRNRVEVI